MFKKIRLSNGLRVVYEQIPYVRSVSLGVWIGTGSRNETDENNGISHFIEHMLFKGTESKNAREIAESIDNIGGQLNAFTGKECTCYYTKTLDTHIDISIELLSDMLLNSKLNEKDIDLERKVILEEINMYEDTPEELVHDILSEIIWKGNSLGYPILGKKEPLGRIDRQSILDYMKENYTTDNSVISVAGNFDEKNLIELLEKHFGPWESGASKGTDVNAAEFVYDVKVKQKETEQVHMCVGLNGLEHGNDKLYALMAVNNIFGGVMSSRLFQRIREKEGLVYSIYSYPVSYRKSGMFAIYAGMNPKHMDRVSEMVADEIKLLQKNLISKDELEKSKEQLKGNYILALEGTGSRMNGAGKSELLLGHIKTPDEVLNKLDSIDMSQIQEVVERVFQFDRFSFAAVGRVNQDFKINKFFE